MFVRLHLPLLSLCFNFLIFYASCKDLLSVRLAADYLMTAWRTQRVVLRGVEWTEDSSVVALWSARRTHWQTTSESRLSEDILGWWWWWLIIGWTWRRDLPLTDSLMMIRTIALLMDSDYREQENSKEAPLSGIFNERNFIINGNLVGINWAGKKYCQFSTYAFTLPVESSESKQPQSKEMRMSKMNVNPFVGWLL